jgi:hypothetical protein
MQDPWVIDPNKSSEGMAMELSAEYQVKRVL